MFLVSSTCCRWRFLLGVCQLKDLHDDPEDSCENHHGDGDGLSPLSIAVLDETSRPWHVETDEDGDVCNDQSKAFERRLEALNQTFGLTRQENAQVADRPVEPVPDESMFVIGRRTKERYDWLKKNHRSALLYFVLYIIDAFDLFYFLELR